jgi:hypothetical protein
MKMYLFFISFLCVFNGLMGFTTSGYSDKEKEIEVPKLIQTLLEKKGISVEELKSNPQLIKQWKQDLYRMRGKQLEQKHRPQLRQQSFGKLPPDSYYQVIIDNNIFRPLGYKKYQWTLKLELIGVMTYADSSKNEAILRSNHPKHRRLTVKVGDTFLERTVTRIEARKVVYTNTNGKEVDISLPRLFDRGTESFETEEKP